jgi:hypothetical protein
MVQILAYYTKFLVATKDVLFESNDTNVNISTLFVPTVGLYNEPDGCITLELNDAVDAAFVVFKRTITV